MRQTRSLTHLSQHQWGDSHILAHFYYIIHSTSSNFLFIHHLQDWIASTYSSLPANHQPASHLILAVFPPLRCPASSCPLRPSPTTPWWPAACHSKALMATTNWASACPLWCHLPISWWGRCHMAWQQHQRWAGHRSRRHPLQSTAGGTGQQREVPILPQDRVRLSASAHRSLW